MRVRLRLVPHHRVFEPRDERGPQQLVRGRGRARARARVRARASYP